MKTQIYTGIIMSLILPAIFTSCTKTTGCTDKNATNFDINAEKSCVGCCAYGETSIANKGNVLFYSTTGDAITVTLSNGTVVTASANTNCNDNSSANRAVLPQGTYTYTATNNNGMNWNGSFTVSTGQCNSIGLTASSAASTKGMLEFATDNTGLGSISVKINGATVGTVTPYVYSATYPGPGFGVSVDAGTYYYSASSANGQQWTGTVQVATGQNTRIYLRRDDMVPVPAGYSHVVFYSVSETDYLVSFGTSTLGSGINTTSTTDLCSQKWVVSTVVPFGTYNWSATTASGKYYSGNVIANASGCINVKIGVE